MFSFLRLLFADKDMDALMEQYEREIRTLRQANHDLTQQKHSTTLEELQDKPEDMEVLQGFTARQRLALYNFLTARAYRLNKDALRESSLWTREDLLKATKTQKNTIPFDREVKPKKPSDFLPSVFNDPVS